MAEKNRTVLFADASPLLREALSCLCESRLGCSVVSLCANGEEALRAIHAQQPSVAIVDFDIPRLFSLEVVRKVRESSVPTRTVILSNRDDRKTVIESLRAGAAGYLLRNAEVRHLKEAIDQAVEGGVYICPLLDVEKVFTPQKSRDGGAAIEALSSREHQVFSMLVAGHRAKEIASRLDLSPKTVDTYRASLMRKLNIHDVAGLVKYAIKYNLTSVGSTPVETQEKPQLPLQPDRRGY